MEDPDDDWLLQLRPLPDRVPATVRIRVALKRLLRSLRLRCVGMWGIKRESKRDKRSADKTELRS